jgi:hypothetical protein
MMLVDSKPPSPPQLMALANAHHRITGTALANAHRSSKHTTTGFPRGVVMCFSEK